MQTILVNGKRYVTDSDEAITSLRDDHGCLVELVEYVDQDDNAPFLGWCADSERVTVYK